MQNCTKCGAKGTQNASFCSVCGAVFGPLTAIPDNPKSLIALGLGAAGFLICGPFTGIPAFLMARSILAGPVSPRDAVLGRLAWWLSLAACAIWFLMIAFFAIVTGSGWSLV